MPIVQRSKVGLYCSIVGVENQVRGEKARRAMESDTLIGDGGGPAEKTSYHAAPAAMPGSGPKFTKKTVFGDVSWLVAC